MKVLWLSNTLFPDIAQVLNENISISGGWMHSLARDLVNNGVTLSVLSVYRKGDPVTKTINGIEYIILKGNKPITQYDKSLEGQYSDLLEEYMPDIVHIHGVEFAFGLPLIRSFPELNYVVSIQGLPSAVAKYYTAGLSFRDIIKNITIRDILKLDTIIHAKNKFAKRGQQLEVCYLKNVNHVIGRTDWDYDHVKITNSKLKYHFCNESLRKDFYLAEKWNINNKKDFSIFLSQAGYPIKGLHMVLKAVKLLEDSFPNIHLRIAGEDITKSDSIKSKLRLSGYGKFIRSLIDQFKLNDKVHFTGPLNEGEMIQEYQNCHIFICPSSIENSPNSLGEAQLLGVPSIASYVGGIPGMISHKTTGLLYRFEEIEMLAQQIRQLFVNEKFLLYLSSQSIKEATIRHDKHANLQKTIEIYNLILSK